MSSLLSHPRGGINDARINDRTECHKMVCYGSFITSKPTMAMKTIGAQPRAYDPTIGQQYMDCTRTARSTETMNPRIAMRNDGSEVQPLATGNHPKIGIWSRSPCDNCLYSLVIGLTVSFQPSGHGIGRDQLDDDGTAPRCFSGQRGRVDR